ncbi:hypothetical protein M0R89_10960 [Halorussus limi]|uniref:Uncharacterized protein n=1 Tax=Halorussus limi TaxID=2938695 RepID=A0A8U0HQ38_9EURY|nr:hypothetical protein [Halorussus limi]UPV73070.1 hypothetical protein M0R89_10960 [Halorussus limi]
MHRRELLGVVGAGATGLAGLLGTRTRGAERDAEVTATGPTTRATTTSDGRGFAGVQSSADRPFATISVGTRAGVRNPENNRPHAIRVWNDSDRARTIGLRLVRRGDQRGAALDRRIEFPADGYLTIRLLEPGDYALAVRPGAGTSDGANGTATTDAATTARATASGGTVEVSRARFDCNDSRTDVAVTADGRVRSETVTTEAECPPEVVSRTFTAFSGSCGSADDANVSFGERSVEVSGSIRVPNPCYGAKLAGVAAPSADTLRVTVATTEPAAGVCTQCVGTVEYAADLRFRDRVPRTVEVVHRRDGGSATVATATRGSATATTRSGQTTSGSERTTGGEQTTTATGADDSN